MSNRSPLRRFAGRLLVVVLAMGCGFAGCSGFAIERVRFDAVADTWVYEGRGTWFDNDGQPDGLFAYNTMADMSLVLVETDYELYEIRRFSFDPSNFVRVGVGLASRAVNIAVRAAMASQGIPVGFTLTEPDVAATSTESVTGKVRSRHEELAYEEAKIRGGLSRAALLAAGLEAALMTVGPTSTDATVKSHDNAAVESHARTLGDAIAELTSQIEASESRRGR